jgi:hypothetical protein
MSREYTKEIEQEIEQEVWGLYDQFQIDRPENLPGSRQVLAVIMALGSRIKRLEDDNFRLRESLVKLFKQAELKYEE